MSSEHPSLTDSVQASLQRAKLLVLDVDGTLTDGRVVYIGTEESQAFDVHDGQGLVWLRRAGVKLAWISGRGSEPTRKRAQELGVEFIVLQCKDKRAALSAIHEEMGIDASQTVAMGDDMPDLALKRGAGFFCAPSNGRAELRSAADLVTEAAGGHGAVRELCELILRAKGEWQGILDATGR